MQCPEFFSPLNNGCVYDCSQHSLFRLTTTSNQPKCEYEFDATVTVDLVPQNPVPIPLPELGSGTPPPIPTLESLRTSDSSRYTAYKTELDRVNGRIQAVLSGLDRTRRINDAFQALQTAELTRATNPIGYQQVRNQYYSLVKGAGWMDDEKNRILTAEIDPELRQYRDAYTAAVQQKVGQQRTLDIIEAVKDRVLSLKDDFQYSTSMFKEQLDRVKSQMNIERRGRETTPINETTTTFYGWLNVVVNLILVALAVYLALTIWAVVARRMKRPEGTYTVQVGNR